MKLKTLLSRIFVTEETRERIKNEILNDMRQREAREVFVSEVKLVENRVRAIHNISPFEKQAPIEHFEDHLTRTLVSELCYKLKDQIKFSKGRGEDGYVSYHADLTVLTKGEMKFD